MKTRNLFIGLACFLILIVALSMSTKSQKPEEPPKFEPIVIGTGGEPKWSPDGTRLAFISGGWLCVADANGRGEIEKIVKLKPWTFDWMSDSAFVASEKRSWSGKGGDRGHNLIIKTVDMRGQVQIIREDSVTIIPKSRELSYISTPVILKDGTVGYYEVHEKPGGDSKVFKIMKEGNLKPETAMKQTHLTGRGLETINGIVKKRIPIDKKYGFLKLSPDETKILAFLGSYTSDLVILDTNGVELAKLGVGAIEIAPGVFASGASSRAQWSPDSKKILYTWFVESERHPEAETSDLYIINADGTGKIQITDTPDEAEHYPVWSPGGTKIAYHSENTGKIFVIKIK